MTTFIRTTAALVLVAVMGCSQDQKPAPAADKPAPTADKPAPAADKPAARALILATTTSTQDSGLLDALLPKFEAAHNVKVKVIAVGTGEALKMGSTGDADVLMVHSRPAEDEFMAAGNGALRLDVMHNEFVLLGPAADPARVKGLDPVAAFKRIAAAGSTFVSRGDRSGTHQKELGLWKAAGATTEGKAWYLSAGQGMGETARIATEKRGYTLADRATFLTLKKRGLELVPLCEGDKRLHNPYGVIVVSQKKFPKVRGDAAERFARWLVTPAIQKLIGEFGVDRFGQPLFIPDAVPAAAPAAAPAKTAPTAPTPAQAAPAPAKAAPAAPTPAQAAPAPAAP
ncbi:MAG: substrate-binding domain-containing protein [Gemmatimonadales bacterium]|nr:substrate-binding domain-containing protein [Gemmatimonadales bacterium]